MNIANHVVDDVDRSASLFRAGHGLFGTATAAVHDPHRLAGTVLESTDDPFDLTGGVLGTLRQGAYLVGNHGKAPSLLAGTRRFDGR